MGHDPVDYVMGKGGYGLRLGRGVDGPNLGRVAEYGLVGWAVEPLGFELGLGLERGPIEGVGEFDEESDEEGEKEDEEKHGGVFLCEDLRR